MTNTKSGQLLTLGREMPLGLELFEKSSEAIKVLVSFRDGIEVFGGTFEALEIQDRIDLSLEVAKLLPRSDDGPQLTVAGGQTLWLLDARLEILAGVPAPEGESVRGIVPLNPQSFLSLSDDGVVRFWTVDSSSELCHESSWSVECVPLFARPGGKSVVCIEVGRLCERDPKNGMLLKSWPKAAPVVSGFRDEKCHTMVTIDEDGQASLWDLHSREQILAFDTPHRLASGHFQSSGVGGVLIGQEGEMLAFRTVGGDLMTEIGPLSVPATDSLSVDGKTIALDENGTLWVVGDEPKVIGGSWAGWSTCGLALPDGRTMVGTATGELLSFATQGDGPPQCRRLHSDAVVAIFELRGEVISIAADGQILSLPAADFLQSEVTELANFGGHSVVSCHIDSDGKRLWLALEEGKIAWIDPTDGRTLGEFEFPEHRIEEIRPGSCSGEILVLTDRGSLKVLRATS